jgi:hypothetical protein
MVNVAAPKKKKRRNLIFFSDVPYNFSSAHVKLNGQFDQVWMTLAFFFIVDALNKLVCFSFASLSSSIVLGNSA